MSDSENLNSTGPTVVGAAGALSLDSEKREGIADDGLMVQDLSKLDVTRLSAMTPEVISRQATMNIGTIGHVAHGKSTVVRSISGVKTVKFKSELVRNITIKLGYANAKLYRSAEPPYTYDSRGSDHPDTYIADDGKVMQLQRHISFVDCPGHDIYMATMLSGAAVMDAALLLVAGNENCPQPQTSEHLAAVEIMQLKNIIILQNKIDLVKQDAALAHYDQIKAFISGTVAGNAPIIPISAQLKYNMDYLCKYIIETIPVPIRDFVSPPKMIVVRSFDVNNPGEEVDTIKGGVAGGSIIQGVLRVGDDVEIRPGYTKTDEEGNHVCCPIFSKIVTLKAEKNDLQYAVPGGLIGVGLQIDPTFTRADKLVGQVLGHENKLPDVLSTIEVSFLLLKRLLGVRTTAGEKGARVAKIEIGETLLINVGSTSTGGRVVAVDGNVAKLNLTYPVCCNVDEKVSLSRRIEGNFRLIGWGSVKSGIKVKIQKR